MKRKTLCLLLAMMLLLSMVLSVTAATQVPTEQQAYQRMITLKEQYPEGMRWTNDNYYGWKGGIYTGGYGCAGFAFLLSDAAFGDLPAHQIWEVDFDQIRVGDILRVNNDTHSVIVMEVKDDYVVLAEGNYNSSIHWGRTLTAAEVEKADYAMTRYQVYKDGSCIGCGFRDVYGHWAHEEIEYCYFNGLMAGVSKQEFAPNKAATRAQVAAILWRAAGSPAPSADNFFTDLTSDWYRDAVIWAAEVGVVAGISSTKFDPNAPISRQDLACMLYRYAKNVRGEYVGYRSDLSKYHDSGAVSGYAAEAMAWADVKGLIQGFTDDGGNLWLRPKSTATRSQLAAILSRWGLTV